MESHVVYKVEYINSEGLNCVVPFDFRSNAIDYYQNLVGYKCKLLNCYINGMYSHTIVGKIK